MKGISPRFIINALNVALGMKEDKSCINPIDVLRALKNNFGHQIGMKDEDVEKYLNILSGDKHSVITEYMDIAKREVNMSFLYAYDDQAEELFNRYMLNVTAYVTKETVYDSITGEESPPDEKLMRDLEEIIKVPENSKDQFRNGIFVQKSRCLEQGKPFTFKDYDPLKEAIEKKLMSDLKNVVQLSIATTTNVSDKAKKKRSAALQALKERGYCDQCGTVLLSFVGEILRKAN
jgi:serine protein kinase